LGQLPGIGQLQERHFKNWAQLKKKQGDFFVFTNSIWSYKMVGHFHWQLQNGGIQK
jgi:hypothetical protein